MAMGRKASLQGKKQPKMEECIMCGALTVKVQTMRYPVCIGACRRRYRRLYRTLYMEGYNAKKKVDYEAKE